MRIVLLGAPGAGKDTLANELLNKYHYTMISPGEILRTEANAKTTLGLKAKNEYWGQGKLCPDELINELVKSRLQILDDKQLFNLLFNGYPRSVGQAEFLNAILSINMVIDLKVTEDIAVERLIKRGRIDDTEKVIRTRFEEYGIKTEPVSDYYKELDGCKYVVVDADATPNDVSEEVFGHIFDAVSYALIL